MACFSMDFLENLLIGLVVIVIIVAIAKLLLPKLLSLFGAPPGGGIIITILGWILWGVVAIFAIILIFDLLSCAFGGGGLHGHLLR